MSLIQQKYYIFETPAITDISYLYSYNINADNTKKTNQLNYNNYDRTRNIVYYDDILLYDPEPKNNIYQGIQLNYCNSNYNSINQFNIFDLSKYISNRLMNFIDQLQLVNQCNRYGSSNDAIPALCSNAFNNYDSKNNINAQINNIQNNILPSYKTQYLSTKKKHLQQQYNDIKNLINRFNQIVVSIKNDNSIPEVDYNLLLAKNREILKIRNDLDFKLGEIYEYKNSNIVNSRNELDNTVYVGVFWSILASSFAYFIFTKL